MPEYEHEEEREGGGEEGPDEKGYGHDKALLEASAHFFRTIGIEPEDHEAACAALRAFCEVVFDRMEEGEDERDEKGAKENESEEEGGSGPHKLPDLVIGIPKRRHG
jgi:hypothetical protein